MCEPIEYRDRAEWLRSRAKRDPYNPSNLAMLEAADEIERLRAKYDRLLNHIEELQIILREAVRGE